MTCESLIFDIDGTLWDSRSLVAEGWNALFREEGLEQLLVTAESITPLFGKTGREIADLLLGDFPEEIRYPLMDCCFEAEHHYLQENPCQVGYPNVVSVLAELSKTHRLFIVSNAQSGYPELCISKLGLAPYIEGHLCFGDTGKPKGQTIRTLMQRYGIGSCVYIGDTQGDRDACRDAGIPFIFASYGLGRADSWDAKIDSLADLLKL